MTELEQWRNERNEALRTLDMDYARRIMPHASGDDVREIAMHKARYACPDIEDDLRHASAAWLRARGYGAMFGTINSDPLLPAEELPR